MEALCPHERLHPLLDFSDVLFALFELADADEVERVRDEVSLDVRVERRVARERGREVDLEQPGPGEG